MGFLLGIWHVAHTVALSAQPAPARTLQQEHAGQIITAAGNPPTLRGDGWLVAPADPPVAIATADCVPVVVATITGACVLHVSRHTLLAGIVAQALQLLAPQKISGVYIGPHICPDHFLFEYAGPGIITFKQRYPAVCTTTPRGVKISLLTAVQQELVGVLRAGSVSPRIDQRCTYETPALPSYRRWLEHKKQGALPRLYTIVTARPMTDKA